MVNSSNTHSIPTGFGIITIDAIKENNDELIGVNITEDTKRVYNKSKYFAHILGYTGAISSEKLDTINKKNKKTVTR